MRLTRKIFTDLLDRIEFRFHQPHDPLPEFEDTPADLGSDDPNQFGAPVTASIANTSFGIDDAAVLRDLAPLTAVPAMSTIAIAYLLFSMTKYLEQDESYVNVGVWMGFSFLAGVLNRNVISIGVDNFSEFGGPAAEFTTNYQKVAHDRSGFFQMDYQEYFRTVHNGKIGLYFYDGNHSYEDQLKGLQVAEPFLSANAVLVVDDTNNGPTRRATLDFLKDRHGLYEILFDQFTSGNGHPTFHNGVMVIRKVT